MRDTSIWTGNPYTSKPYVSLSVRQRYPNFRWRNGNTVYALANLGEDWGDSPGTVAERRERDLPTRYRYGGFVVAGDSATLASGNILRATSLRAGNQGDDVWWREVSTPSHLATINTLTFTDKPKTWTGIGLAKHQSGSKARLFYFRSSDAKLAYRDYTPGSGFAAEQVYPYSPAFPGQSLAVAPIADEEGYIITYDPTGHKVTLHRFYGTGNQWWSYTMPMRYAQNPLNCHWFDAVALGVDRLITFNVNGTQYATSFDPGIGFRDPWPILALDVEFGGAQTRICKLTNVGNRVLATAWSRFAGSSDDYEVSYYHLLWTDDGVHWAMPEEGYIGQLACRGKLHTIGNTAYVVGASLSYVGDAVSWLGGSAGVQTSVSANVVGHNLVQDLDKASDAKLPLLIPDSFDKSLFVHGNELVYGIGLVGESAITVATMTLDTPDNVLEFDKQTMEMICRGPLKRLISFQAPMDQTFSGAEGYHADFTQGSLYARSGVWGHEAMGVAYCDRHEGEEALATIGMEYSGQFQISTRLRIVETVSGAAGGVVFWYEGPKDHFRLELADNTATLCQIVGDAKGILASSAITGGLQGNKWYDVLIRYSHGVLTAYILPDGGSWQQVADISIWSDPEPTHWYAGLYCVLPSTATSESLGWDATEKVSVQSTDGFPGNGKIKVNGEIIGYGAKAALRFGANTTHSIVRGMQGNRASHPTDSPVTIAGQRFESDHFSVFHAGRAMSVADACAHLVTRAGAPFVSVTLLDNQAGGTRVFPELHGHSWVLDGAYDGDFSLFFWTNTTNPPEAGIQLEVTETTATLSDLVGGQIASQPIDGFTGGPFRCQVQGNTIFLWLNGRFITAFHVPGKLTFRVGAVACDGGVTRLTVDELFEPAEGVVWAMRESARNVLQRLLEGRDAFLRERSDGSVQVTLLEKRDDLGELDGRYFVLYQRASADQEWASAMVAWGAEDWVMVMEPTADRLRWTAWQTPHIYDRTTLRHRAMRRLRKLWALKDLRVLRGPFDPRVEVGDEVSIAGIRGIPAGRYLVRSIEVIGEPALLDMKLTVQALPDELPVAVWPIRPGIDRPAEG